MHGNRGIIPSLASQRGKLNMINRLAASEYENLQHETVMKCASHEFDGLSCERMKNDLSL